MKNKANKNYIKNLIIIKRATPISFNLTPNQNLNMNFKQSATTVTS